MYLAINEANRNGSYSIGWFLRDEGDFGLMLGQWRLDGESLEGESDDTRETDAACDAIRKLSVGQGRPDDLAAREWTWESKSGATKALRAAKAAAAAAKTDRPMPEWAVKALAAGFKAPKGWKPPVGEP